MPAIAYSEEVPGALHRDISKANAKGLAQFYDRDAPAEMAKAGMDGFQEYMLKPERRAEILKRLESVRKRAYK
jgi:multiple sugar transport system substrate-binding protein